MKLDEKKKKSCKEVLDEANTSSMSKKKSSKSKV
jgi:hypothetical protein